jgi:hypothetical protein
MLGAPNKKTREREFPGLLFRCRLINQLTRQVSPLDNSFFKSPGPVLAFASSSCLLIAPLSATSLRITPRAGVRTQRAPVARG